MKKRSIKNLKLKKVKINNFKAEQIKAGSYLPHICIAQTIIYGGTVVASWKFTFVSDIETKEKLSKVSWLNTEKVTDSDTIIVFSRIDDTSLFEQQIETNLPKGAVDYYKEFIKPKPDAEIKAWFDKQVYLSVGILLSACAEMGIDSTPMEGIEPDNYDKILGMENHKTLVAVAIGYRDEDDRNQPNKNPKSRRNINEVIKSI